MSNLFIRPIQRVYKPSDEPHRAKIEQARNHQRAVQYQVRIRKYVQAAEQPAQR